MIAAAPSLPRRRPLLPLTGAVLASVLFGLLGAGTRTGAVVWVDRVVQHLVQATRSPALDGPMQVVTRLGSGYVLIPAVLVACLVLASRHRALVVAATLGVVGSVLVEVVGKWIVARPRPNHVPYGYPSGHVMGIVVFLGVTLFALHRLGASRGQRRAAAVAAVLLVAAVAYSRLYFNAHWLSDIVGGAAAGIALVFGLRAALDDV